MYIKFIIDNLGAFSKFTLKPSALSQHTANFNKLLEQVQLPKSEPIQLIKPVESLNHANENLTEKKSENASKENEYKHIIILNKH